MTEDPIPFRPRVVPPVEDVIREDSPASELTDEMSELWKDAMLDALTDGGDQGGLVVFVDRAGLVGCNSAGWDIYKMIGALSIALDITRRTAQGMGAEEED
jgi:hypothetical protein